MQKENLIVLKGYQGGAGLSHSVFRVSVRARTKLKGFEIVVYSASQRTRIYCKYIKKRFGVSISALPKHHFNQGALPIQTNTSCIGNLISDDVTGFTPSPKEDELYEALISALELIRGDNKFMNHNDTALRNYTSEVVASQRFLFAYDLQFDSIQKSPE